VRESLAENTPIRWQRVNKLPGYVYFDHSIPALPEAGKRGVQIITFNPARERGLEFFVNPQNPAEILTGKETAISSQYHQVKVGGDIAVLLGMCKHVFAADDAAQQPGKRLLDVAFIAQHTDGLAEFEAKVRDTSWEEIEVASGLSRQDIERAA
jgi:anaerobic selenocysteine-containing dehydrogenase